MVGHVGIIDFCLIYQYQIKKLYKKKWPETKKYKSIMENTSLWQHVPHTTDQLPSPSC